MNPSGRIEVISMAMKTEYRTVTTVEEILEYIGDSKEVAFDYETAPNDGYRDEDKAALDPAKSHIVTMSISVKEVDFQSVDWCLMRFIHSRTGSCMTF